jgi:glycosyltransferase involved in cell wall biosynthesis
MIDEMVVVDSGSTDNTIAIAQHFGCRIFNYPSEQSFNYSHALNIGLSECIGEHVLIISSHCVLAFRDVVRTMNNNLQSPSICGVYCIVIPRGVPLVDRDDSRRGKLTTVISKDIFDGGNGLWNSCSMIKRASWLEHPFDVTMPTAEDQEWAYWHYKNTHSATVCIRNAGVLNMNPFSSDEKSIRERIAVATRLQPSLRSCRAIFGLCFDAVTFLSRFNFRGCRKALRMAYRLLLSRFVNIKYESRYF